MAARLTLLIAVVFSALAIQTTLVSEEAYGHSGCTIPCGPTSNAEPGLSWAMFVIAALATAFVIYGTTRQKAKNFAIFSMYD